LRNALEILNTASEAADAFEREYAICMSRSGQIRIVAESAGWSAAALADECGADTLYWVRREARAVHVEAWSRTESCHLRREIPFTGRPWNSTDGR
jgi:hypothetical protein